MSTEPPFKRTILSQSLPSGAQLAKESGEQILRWNISIVDMHHIRMIVERAVELANAHKVPMNGHLLAQDLACVHLNSCPLELWQILMSGGDDFSHDVLGIRTHIDRKTGQLKDGFKPRLAKKVN